MRTALLFISISFALFLLQKHTYYLDTLGQYNFPVKVYCLDDEEASAILGNDLRCFSTN